ncbi:HlyD family secretion protein [Avrilella dinanensis]|uniref:HlyD family secretion protein n=1 Tax=Avrilella dinanensis TaxID=2008672 RepID=A0A2M9R645_9FLAO|nr:HlyD family efflux transporter periplasmic adaptor subunit [Avrilella dinanensis]PJR04193.1 HlyD family secretion protein [Avrilella dinanensis]
MNFDNNNTENESPPLEGLGRIELRSEEVQDILTRVPHWMIRWGNVLILFIIVLIFLFSWLIRYPDIITTEITITTQIPPEKLVANSSGKIEKIFVEDRSSVAENTPLAVIENPADYNDVFLLKSVVDSIKINNDDFIFPLEKLPVLNLGTIESAYALFQKDYLAYKLNKDLEPYQIEITAQNIETSQQHERLKLLIGQKEIGQKELQYKKTELNRYKNLYEKGVISAQEWEQKNVEYLQQEKSNNSLQSQISQLRSSLNDLNRNKKTTTVNQSKDNINLLRNVILSFNQLKKSITEWELTYVLRSSISGQVSFMQIWTENQTINAGENTFVIVPQTKSDFVGKIKAPALNSGKIKTGQAVNIRLANYPDREFGIVKGEVKTISLTPDKENNLLIDVTLPDGLETSYDKEIIFQQEMTGTADIITEDLRLIERLLYQFRDMFSRS